MKPGSGACEYEFGRGALDEGERVGAANDGLYHGARERLDERRDWALVNAGYQVLRFDAADVMADVEAIVARVGAEVALLR